MQQTFFGRYRLSRAYDGAPEEISRNGAAINYKAQDIRENDPVALQLIPIASVDETARDLFEERARAALKLDHLNIAKVLAVGVEGDSLVLVSEYLEGETADAWLATHGPMPADAVLRIGLQVVRALHAANYHGITHRAIQPANILIVPGQTAEGGWPLIKLLNFGLAGQEVHSNETSVHALAPPIPPQFASPEQLLNKPLDFRSEIYSLGATMCFLLTGAVPLAVGGMKARLRARRLPELRRAPRALHRLLVHMLRENPENRPLDPIAFETELRDCLTKVERRQALGRKIGLPLGGVVPRSATRASTSSVGRQVALGFLAVAALLLTAALVAAFLLPADSVPFLRQKNETKLVGVPDNSNRVATAATAAPPVATPAAAPNSSASPVTHQIAETTASAPPTASASPVQVASAQHNATDQPAPPAEGPAEPVSTPATSPSNEVAANGTASSDLSSTDTTTNSSPARSKRTATNDAPRLTSTKRQRVAQSRPDNSADAVPPHVSHGRLSARVVGITPDGRLVLRLPSGRIVTAYPGQQQNAPERSHRVIQRQSPDDQVPAERGGPYQPFNPDYPFGD